MNRRSFFRSLAAAIISVPLARMVGAETPDRFLLKPPNEWKEMVDQVTKMFKDARAVDHLTLKRFQAKIDTYASIWSPLPKCPH